MSSSVPFRSMPNKCSQSRLLDHLPCLPRRCRGTAIATLRFERGRCVCGESVCLPLRNCAQHRAASSSHTNPHQITVYGITPQYTTTPQHASSATHFLMPLQHSVRAFWETRARARASDGCVTRKASWWWFWLKNWHCNSLLIKQESNTTIFNLINKKVTNNL